MVRAERDVADHLGLAGLGDLVADRGRVQRAGPGDGVQQDLGGGIGVGDVLGERLVRLRPELLPDLRLALGLGRKPASVAETEVLLGLPPPA